MGVSQNKNRQLVKYRQHQSVSIGNLRRDERASSAADRGCGVCSELYVVQYSAPMFLSVFCVSRRHSALR